LLALQRLIKEGETVRKPGIRRKPVMAALPEGITIEDIRAELADVLRQDATVNVEALNRERIRNES